MKDPFPNRLFSRRGFLYGLAVVVLLFIGPGLYLLMNPASPKVEVAYINVGNVGSAGVIGDAILLTSSEGKVVLIDGGYPNSGTLEYLQAKNIKHIDMVVNTHPHDDHTGGLIEVIDTIPVDLYVHNSQPLDSPIYEELQESIKKAGVPTKVVKTGDKLPFGRLTFDVLSPRKINPTTINNNSIVMRLVVGKVSFLFTGDMQKLEEARLLSTKAEVKADIMKIAHHGASTSSSAAFIEKVSPELAIYSAGKGNSYHFPEQVTLDNFKAYNVAVYGTDNNGTILVTTDGKNYTVLTERGGAIP